MLYMPHDFSPGHPQWDEENWSLYWVGIQVSLCYLYSSLLMQSEVFSLMCRRVTAAWSSLGGLISSQGGLQR